LDIGEERMKFWTTPHGRNFGAVADLFALRYQQPASVEALPQGVTEALTRPGCTLFEVEAPAHGVREQAVEIAARLDRELAAVGAE